MLLSSLSNPSVATLPMWIMLAVVLCAGFAAAGQSTFQPRTRVSIEGTQWRINGQVVHPGSAAEGLLMNARMINTIFEDEGPAASNLPEGFDPTQNTERFIRRIPEYVDNGVGAFTVGLQGGMPGYEGAINSAFNADGSLREAYLERAARVIEAADANGAVVILSLFYQRQHHHDRALAGRDAIRRAVTEAASWVQRQGYTNVLLEISNEYRHNGFRNWQDGDWLRSAAGQVELIELARRTAPGLLVSTSGMGDGRMEEPIARAADFITIHFNNTPLTDIPQRIRQVQGYDKPVICNEDNKVGQAGAEGLRLSVENGAAWGFMHLRWNQHAPFEFEGADDDPDVYAMFRRLTRPGGDAEAAATDAASITSILIAQPKDGDTFPAGQPITIRSEVVTPPDRPAARVEVYAGTRRIGVAERSPWTVLWQIPPAGKHDLLAVLRDPSGEEITRSNIVDIVVADR